MYSLLSLFSHIFEDTVLAHLMAMPSVCLSKQIMQSLQSKIYAKQWLQVKGHIVVSVECHWKVDGVT